MPRVNIELRNISGTNAAAGWAGSHTVVVDRPEGKAGGMGLGFNGAQLLALSLGGCFCNDLRYAAEQLGIELADIAVSVFLELNGEPLVATHAEMQVRCTAADGSDAAPVIARAKSICTVANTLRRGMDVTIWDGV